MLRFTKLETPMDDAKLPDGMTLDDIGRRLVAIDAKVTSLQADMTAVKSNLGSLESDVTSLRTEVRSGFQRVDQELNAAKIRDEKAHDLLKFNLEAREGLRESMEARFDAVEKKQDEQIDLLKHAIRRK